jgi:hypothetical protein
MINMPASHFITPHYQVFITQADKAFSPKLLHHMLHIPEVCSICVKFNYLSVDARSADTTKRKT